MPESTSTLTRRRILTHLAGVSLLAVTALHPLPALADKRAEQYVVGIANQAIAAARARSTSAFHRLVRRHGAVSSVASFALGKYRRKMPRSMRKRYNALVSRFIARLFAENASSFAGQRYVVKGSSARTNKDIIVKGVLQFANSRQAEIQWRVLRSGRGYRVFDVRVKGVWLAVQMRQQFVSVLNKSRGDFNALMRYLQS